MSDTLGTRGAHKLVFSILAEGIDPAKDLDRRRRLRRLPEALTARWGTRFGEWPDAAFRTNPVAALTLRECLKVHAAALTPFILGGGATHDEFHYQDITHHAATGPNGELQPVRVRVTVDLDTGFWSAGRDQRGEDLFELARWVWSAPGCTASVEEIEARFMAHLGLATLDLLARPEAAQSARRARTKRPSPASGGAAPERRE